MLHSLTITTDPALFACQQTIHQLIGPAQITQPAFNNSARPFKRPASASSLLNVEEAAEFLHRNVNKSSIYTAIHDGSLWAKQIGKSYYTTPEALENYIACQDHD